MITLYTWKTPNGRKPAIMLEELGIPYNIHPVDLSKNEQFSEEFLDISPNNKIPGMVDEDPYIEGPMKIFESGAILTYLAEKYGKYLPEEGPERYQTLEWVYWQVGGLGPMLGQLGYFAEARERDEVAFNQFREEADRLLTVLDKRLQETVYLAGDMYTIADMASYPWAYAAATMLAEPLKESLAAKPNLKRWLNLVGDRPAVQKGMKILEESNEKKYQ